MDPSLPVAIVEYIVRDAKRKGKYSIEAIAEDLELAPDVVKDTCTQLIQAGYLEERWGKLHLNYDQKDVAPVVKYARKSGTPIQDIVLDLLTGQGSPLRTIDLNFQLPLAPAKQNPPAPMSAPLTPPPEVTVPEYPESRPAQQTFSQLIPPKPPAPITDTPITDARRKESVELSKAQSRSVSRRQKDIERIEDDIQRFKSEFERFVQVHPVVNPEVKTNTLGHLRQRIDRHLNGKEQAREAAVTLIKDFVGVEVITLNGISYNKPEQLDDILPRLSDQQLQDMLSTMLSHIKKQFKG